MLQTRPKEATRQRILQAAASIMHKHGYQGMSIGDLLKEVGISKGALYHHFKSKQELAYAVLDELHGPMMLTDWQVVFDADDPISAMITFFGEHQETLTSDCIVYGCPINNLSQEMAPLDEGFKQRIGELLTQWRGHLAAAFAKGQVKGFVDPKIDPVRTASVLVASTQGMVGLAKSTQDLSLAKELFQGMIELLERLRPCPQI